MNSGQRRIKTCFTSDKAMFLVIQGAIVGQVLSDVADFMAISPTINSILEQGVSSFAIGESLSSQLVLMATKSYALGAFFASEKPEDNLAGTVIPVELLPYIHRTIRADISSDVLNCPEILSSSERIYHFMTGKGVMWGIESAAIASYVIRRPNETCMGIMVNGEICWSLMEEDRLCPSLQNILARMQGLYSSGT
jgi:hypothetical protein